TTYFSAALANNGILNSRLPSRNRSLAALRSSMETPRLHGVSGALIARIAAGALVTGWPSRDAGLPPDSGGLPSRAAGSSVGAAGLLSVDASLSISSELRAGCALSGEAPEISPKVIAPKNIHEQTAFIFSSP